MPANNRKQAMLPEGAEFIDNPIGTACGFAVTIGKAQKLFGTKWKVYKTDTGSKVALPASTPRNMSSMRRLWWMASTPFGRYAAIVLQTIAAAAPPPESRIDAAANCAEPANVVADMTIASTEPKPEVCASTP